MERLIEFVGNHPYLSTAFVGVLAWLIIGELRQRTHRFGDVSPMEATRLINHENALVIDVRAENEYQQGHILNAIHMPLEKISDQPKKLEKYKERPVITYCQSGQRSATACRRLQEQGFTSLYHLRGGIASWQRDNLPLVKD